MALGHWLVGSAVYGLIAWKWRWFPFKVEARPLTPAERARSARVAPGVLMHISVVINQVINTLRQKGVPYTRVVGGKTDGSGGVGPGQPSVIVYTSQHDRAVEVLPEYVPTPTGGKVWIEVEGV